MLEHHQRSLKDQEAENCVNRQEFLQYNSDMGKVQEKAKQVNFLSFFFLFLFDFDLSFKNCDVIRAGTNYQLIHQEHDQTMNQEKARKGYNQYFGDQVIFFSIIIT